MNSSKDIKMRVRKRLLAQSSGIFNRDRIDPHELRVLISTALDHELTYESVGLNQETREKIINQLVDELVGFGPIEKVLKDPTISESYEK